MRSEALLVRAGVADAQSRERRNPAENHRTCMRILRCALRALQSARPLRCCQQPAALLCHSSTTVYVMVQYTSCCPVWRSLLFWSSAEVPSRVVCRVPRHHRVTDISRRAKIYVVNIRHTKQQRWSPLSFTHHELLR
jgi:hypothetical protein